MKSLTALQSHTITKNFQSRDSLKPLKQRLGSRDKDRRTGIGWPGGGESQHRKGCFSSLVAQELDVSYRAVAFYFVYGGFPLEKWTPLRNSEFLIPGNISPGKDIALYQDKVLRCTRDLWPTKRDCIWEELRGNQVPEEMTWWHSPDSMWSDIGMWVSISYRFTFQLTIRRSQAIPPAVTQSAFTM